MWPCLYELYFAMTNFLDKELYKAFISSFAQRL